MAGTTTSAYKVNVGTTGYGNNLTSSNQVIKLKYRAKPEIPLVIKVKHRYMGNLGCWCRFDANVFCQEDGGCVNCAAYTRVSEKL